MRIDFFRSQDPIEPKGHLLFLIFLESFLELTPTTLPPHRH